MSNVPASVLNPQISNLLANRGSHGVFADSGRKGNPFRQILPVARQPAQLDQKRLIVGFLRLPFNAAANEPRILSKNVPLQAIMTDVLSRNSRLSCSARHSKKGASNQMFPLRRFCRPQAKFTDGSLSRALRRSEPVSSRCCLLCCPRFLIVGERGFLNTRTQTQYLAFNWNDSTVGACQTCIKSGVP